MNKEVWRGQNSLRFTYYRYKDSPYYSFLILFVVICVCFVLIFNVIIPQVYSWFSISEEATATQGRINILRQNLDFISLQINKTTLENNRQIALRALPVDKDFGDIINTIAISAVKTGISVDDFNFSPGQTTSTNSSKDDLGLSDIKVTLSLTGEIKEVKKFITEINEKLPINKIESIDTSNTRTTISILFFSKPYKAAAIRNDTPIRVISSENGELLGTLSAWSSNIDAMSSGDNQPQASSSALPLF